MAKVTAEWEDWSAEGDTQEEALEYLLERVEMDVRDLAQFEEVKVFEVEMNFGTVGVLAASEPEARNNAKQQFNRKLRRAREGSDLNQDARDILTDLYFQCDDIYEAGRDTYEIDRDGYWNEGEL